MNPPYMACGKLGVHVTYVQIQAAGVEQLSFAILLPRVAGNWILVVKPASD